MMSGQATEEQKPSSFYLSQKAPFEINSMQIIPNTNLIAYTGSGTSAIYFSTYDEKGINTICSTITLPENYSPQSLCISPGGSLVCGALVYPKSNPAFLIFEISAGVENAKQMESYIFDHTLENMVSVALNYGNTAHASLDSDHLYLYKRFDTLEFKYIGWNLSIRSLVLLPNKDLLVICREAILFFNSFVDSKGKDQIDRKKIISSDEALGIKDIHCGALINTGELVLTYQDKDLGQKILFCDLDLTNLSLKATRVIDLASEEITMFSMMQTRDHQFVCSTGDFKLALSRYDVTFHLKKEDVETELNRVLTRDTAGVVLSYLHTASLFKPASILPVNETKKDETLPLPHHPR